MVALLIVFAFAAGAATALSPCVLPVLPVALAAGVTGGRRRPLGVVAGLALSFTFATVALVYVVDGLGLPGGLLRTVAIVVLLACGAALVVPRAAARVEASLSRLTVSAPGGRLRASDGLAGGLVVGLSLGLVYAPCAGPILAGVITVSASQSFTAARLAVALAYGLGSAVALYAVLRGGRRLTRRLGPYSARLQTGMGVVMIAVALLILGGYDTRFQTAIANDLPAFLVDPTQRLEQSAEARDRLAALRGGHGDGLPVLAAAPDFAHTERWFNTPGGRPLSMRGLRGKVVLVDFWTYTCINCIRTLPWLKAWDARYRRDGLVIVGVHTPEFPFERDAGNVERAIAQNGLRYPVVQDNAYGTWQAYGNTAWPAEYFIDARGRVRYVHLGEGDYGRKEAIIRALLAEAGRAPGRGLSGARGQTASAGVTTPESYLGAARAERFDSGRFATGTYTFTPGPPPLPDHLAYAGRWRIRAASATAVRGASIRLAFGARRVYLVLGTRAGVPRRVRVLLDGRPIPARAAGSDVHGASVRVRRQRLYSLVALPRVERHLLTLRLDPGVSGYAFTFG